MVNVNRRLFLGASAGGVILPYVLGADKPKSVETEDAAFNPQTLFLTWHRDPTTTMVVQWVGTRGETADTKIYYRPLTQPPPPVPVGLLGAGSLVGAATLLPLAAQFWQVQPTEARPYPGTDFKVFRAELLNLRPGTDYEFRIGKASPIYRFRTMPAKATDTIQFISGGDVGVNVHAVANNLVAAGQDPLFVVIGGDLGYDNGTSVEISLAFLRNYSRHMIGKNNRLIPLIPCIGNHEVAGGYEQPRKKAPFFYALFDGLFPDTGYNVLDFGDYLSLVLLDTNHTSPIGGAQADWLERTLQSRREHPHVLVVNHVPAYPSARPAVDPKGKAATGAGNRKYWVPLFEKYRVPVVLEHHDHTFKRSKPLLGGLADRNGVLYLGDGSWGRIRGPQKMENLSYLASVKADYHLSLHRLQGDERFHLALDENGRVMDVTHTGQRLGGATRTAGN
jgi:hypothetical protein